MEMAGLPVCLFRRDGLIRHRQYGAGQFGGAGGAQQLRHRYLDYRRGADADYRVRGVGRHSKYFTRQLGGGAVYGRAIYSRRTGGGRHAFRFAAACAESHHARRLYRTGRGRRRGRYGHPLRRGTRGLFQRGRYGFGTDCRRCRENRPSRASGLGVDDGYVFGHHHRLLDYRHRAGDGHIAKQRRCICRPRPGRCGTDDRHF